MTVAAPPPATTTRRTQWWWLGFLSMVVFQPTFDPDATTFDWVLAAAIAVGYVPLYLYGERCQGQRRLWVVSATLVLGMVFTPFNSGAAVLFIYAAAFSGWIEPAAVARRWMAACFGLLAVAALYSSVPFPYNVLAFGIPLGLVWIVGLSTMAEAERDRESVRLRVENARVEHLATMAERDRIARDLHDLLGHTLTAVVVRAQLVQRLAEQDPARARAEAAGIEHAARDALSAVRETVAGYRTTSLADELVEASAALAAAGVEVHAEGLDVELAPEVESALAMALREAVTNVVRHAGARTCRVTLVHDGTDLRLEVVDDGRGGGGPDGNGLRGMRERIAALGGRVERIAGAGTRLVVAVPAEVAA